MKKYLGDGVYAVEDDAGTIVLTTENGIDVTNTIYLDPDVINALQDYLEELH